MGDEKEGGKAASQISHYETQSNTGHSLSRKQLDYDTRSRYSAFNPPKSAKSQTSKKIIQSQAANKTRNDIFTNIS